MKRILVITVLVIAILGGAFWYVNQKVTRFDIPKGELKWSTTRPRNAKMCIPAAFTDTRGRVVGHYRINGKTYSARKGLTFRVSLKGDKFYISRQWLSNNGFQQFTLVYNSRPIGRYNSQKAIRRALCKDNKGTFILQSNYPMTMSAFAKECSKHCTNATYLDMGEYGYGYIKNRFFKRPLFIWGIFTKHKQTNWLYVE